MGVEQPSRAFGARPGGAARISSSSSCGDLTSGHGGEPPRGGVGKSRVAELPSRAVGALRWCATSAARTCEPADAPSSVCARRGALRTMGAVAAGFVMTTAAPWALGDRGMAEDRAFESAVSLVVMAFLTVIVLEAHSCWWLHSRTVVMARRFFVFQWIAGALFSIYTHVKFCSSGGGRVYCKEVPHRETLRLGVEFVRDVATWIGIVWALDMCRRLLRVLESSFGQSLGAMCLTKLTMFMYSCVAVGATMSSIDGMSGGRLRQEVMWVFAALFALCLGSLCVIVVLVIVGFRRVYHLAADEVNRARSAAECKKKAVAHARKLCRCTPVCLVWMPVAWLTTYLDMPSTPRPPNRLTEAVMHAANMIMLVMTCKCIAVLCGIRRKSAKAFLKLCWSRPERGCFDMDAASAWTTGNAPWDEKVRDLASRGVTVRALLAFYRRLGTPESMPHFDAAAHTTADVVRQAIIPQSRGQEHSSGALAVALMGGRETVPQHMVTHSWSNRFSHLVAAVVAHALGAPSFEQVLPRLGDELGVLESELFWKGTLDEAYWICAFAVDQHAAICGAVFASDVDTVTGMAHPVCPCREPKYVGSTPPLGTNGQSTPCEINKFVDMMSYLVTLRPGFSRLPPGYHGRCGLHALPARMVRRRVVHCP